MSKPKYTEYTGWMCTIDRTLFDVTRDEGRWTFVEQVSGGDWPDYIELFPAEAGYSMHAWNSIDALEIDVAKAKRWLERHGLPDGSRCKIVEVES